MLHGLPHRMLRLFWSAWPPAARRRALPHLIAGIDSVSRFRLGLPDVDGLLRQLSTNGFTPSGVIDIGANVGAWTTMAAEIFPGVPILMVEGNPEHQGRLASLAGSLGSHVACAPAVLGPERREQVSFYQAGPGSGVLRELTTNTWATITTEMRTLDTVVTGTPVAATGPGLLLKLDVQGYELEVLKGGTQTLARTEVAILEVATIPYNDAAPLLHEVVAFMAEQGMVVLDFCGQFRRETDHALFQTDVVFARRDSALRAHKAFWKSEGA